MFNSIDIQRNIKYKMKSFFYSVSLYFFFFKDCVYSIFFLWQLFIQPLSMLSTMVGTINWGKRLVIC